MTETDIFRLAYFVENYIPMRVYDRAGFLLGLGQLLDIAQVKNANEFIDTSYRVIMHTCAEEGNVEALKVMIAIGADPNMATDKITPIHAAAENGHIDCVKALRKAGAFTRYKFKYRKPVDIYEVANNAGYKI